MVDKTDQDHGTLKIGDHVMFKDMIKNCTLSVEGILMETLNGTEGILSLQDSLFCVHLARQYSASRDLKAFIESRDDNGPPEDESAKKYLMALERGRDNERKLNDNYMRKKHGQKVNFGDIIQLFHIKSGKYLTISPEELANDERENVRVKLDVNGDVFSWLRVCPRFKIDKDGDRILNGAELFLSVQERTNEFVHIADRRPYADYHREVNCALEATSWKLTIYQSGLDCRDESVLLYSQLVYINDPETRSNLAVSQPLIESLDDPVDGEEEEEDSEVLQLRPANASTEQIDSNFLWFLESSSALVGGPVRWKTEQVRFRHMNTNKYLQLECLLADDVDDESLGEITRREEYLFATTDNPDSQGTLFSLNELNSTSKLLSNAKALQIGVEGVFIERGEPLENSANTYSVRGTRDKALALSLIVHRFSSEGAFYTNEKDEAVIADSAQEDKEPLDVYTGLSARQYLRKYCDMIVVPRTDSVSTVWPTAIASDVKFFSLLAKRTVAFSQGHPISVNLDRLDLKRDKGDAVLCRRRQNLMREQGTLEILLRMIKKLEPVTERQDRLRNASLKSKRKKSREVSEEERAMVRMGQSVLQVVFDLLFYCVRNNQENQMFVADFLPVLLAHLSAQPKAGECVTEMLNKNIELQETKITAREIQIFVTQLRSSKMNAMYLQLLQACCSCEGKGVDGNQGRVANLLFSDTNDIIIELHADYSSLTPLKDWLHGDMYIPQKVIAGSPLRGETLVTKGLPKLSLAWTTNSIDFSPLGLFGKLSVNIEELFDNKVGDKLGKLSSTASDGRPKTKKQASEDQKRAVADYFVAEMMLGAEMCLDRNYIAMNKLDKLFPFEVLVAILKKDVVPRLKAAACRLLMCLYVDRDPQASSVIPCLTRTWSDTKKNTEPQLPYVDVGRRSVFGVIQQIVSDHVREIANQQWGPLSWHMLKMLHTLVAFNFYGTNDKMNDVIKPLLLALDRSQMQHELEEDHTAGKIKKTKTMRGKNKKIDSAAATDASQSNNLDESLQLLDGNETDKMDNTISNDKAALTPPSVLIRARNCLAHAATVCLSAVMCTTTGKAKIDIAGGSVVTAYKLPSRYVRASVAELDTMVEAVTILSFAQKVIEDRNISLLMRKFYEWESGITKETPGVIFEGVISEGKKVLTLDCVGEPRVKPPASRTDSTRTFDEVMLDILMYVHKPLVQITLEVLMAHHSARRSLLDHAAGVQLLASQKKERLFHSIDGVLKQLEENAETHELWGELESDGDRAKNKSTKEIMRDLIDYCRVRRFVLEHDEEFMSDADIQDMYRHLGCFDICMKVLNLFDSVEADENGEFDEVALNTRELCLMCNNLLYWFFLACPKNQELGFTKLTFWLDTLDAGIDSHHVVSAIFKGNESLMKRVDHIHLSKLVERIVKDGQSPHYLALFAAIPSVGNSNILKNQMEIVKQLTSPGALEKVSCFLVPVDHPDYEEKRALMAPYLDVKNVSLDDLPPKLAYHLMFLEVLSGCTVGRQNITTVEAKVQSVFNYEDIAASILDPGTLLLAKIVMGRFLLNAVVEVELPLPGLFKSFSMWKLLESFGPLLDTAKAEIHKAYVETWDSVNVKRQDIEYMTVAIKIISRFFAHYETSFRSSAPPLRGADKSVRFTRAKANELIARLFHSISEVHELNSPILSDEVKTYVLDALVELSRKAPNNKQINNAHFLPKLSRGVSVKGGAGFSSGPPSPTKYPQVEGGTPMSPTMAPLHAKKKTEQEMNELALVAKYRSFLKELDSDATLQLAAQEENLTFISILEELPFVATELKEVADVRYETLIRKLVSHIRESISLVNGAKCMEARETKTAIWVIRAFRLMIEHKMGMTIDQRDDDGGAEQDEAAAPVVNALNACGATALCLDLIALGIDETLQLEAVKLGIGLLFKEGGAKEVQGLMHAHLSKSGSDLFFKQVQATLKSLQEFHNVNSGVEANDTLEPPAIICIVRFLQLMCEGHYIHNQDIMREQPHNNESVNLLDSFVTYLNELSRLVNNTSTDAGIRLTATILEVIQGPCEGNQKHFALETELVEALNRINRSKFFKGCVVEKEIELKKNSIDIFQGLLEGQGTGSVVYERVLSVIHLDIIHSMSIKITTVDLAELAKSGSKEPPPTEECVVLQTECVVLLQMLCNFKPSLYDELGISKNIEDIVGSGTAMIEVIWRGDIHRRFFHVPKICEFLAKNSKDNLVEFIDRSNAENKLIDFLARSHELYREIKHQQFLTDKGLSRVFSRQVQNIATWCTFGLAIIINALFLAYYSYRSGAPLIPAAIVTVTDILNYAQVAVSFFTLVLWLVVRSPVNYQTFRADKHGHLETVLLTATDPLTMYYVLYLVISVLGAAVENYFCALLLLDIVVKNSTTRDVLNSIVTPRKQLAMGLLLEAFVVYIYSFYIFFFFREDIDPYCNTLYDCLKVTLSYGFQNGGGIADSFTHSTGSRLLLDLSFYCVVLVILLNVIFGMIIDTFSSLRADKLARLKDTTEVCFICGIEKQIFDRASDEPDGFKQHIKIDHNMWNYLYFIFMLWEQDKDDDDGLEQFVRQSIDAGEVSWMPMNKAMRLEQVASKADIVRRELGDSVRAVGASLSAKLDEFHADVSQLFQQLMHSLRQEGNGTHGLNTPMSALLEYDDLGGEEGGVDYGDDNEADESFGRHVSIGVVDVEGMHLAEEELRTLSIRVVRDSDMFVLPQVEVQDGCLVIFDADTLLPLFDNVYPQDRRVSQLQFLMGTQGAKVGLKFLGEVEIHAAEFLTANDDAEKVVVKHFQQPDNSAATCSVRVISRSYKAYGYGRDDMIETM